MLGSSTAPEIWSADLWWHDCKRKILHVASIALTFYWDQNEEVRFRELLASMVKYLQGKCEAKSWKCNVKRGP